MKARDIMEKNIVSVEPDAPLSSALAKMRQNRVNQLPVMKNGRLYGMLELKKIVTRDVDPSSTKCSTLSINVPTVDANSSVENVADLLLRSGLKALPVVEGSKVVGIISETDMMKATKYVINIPDVSLSHISSIAECVDKDSVIGKVKNIMLDKNVSRVPVVAEGKVVGVICTLDMIRVLEGKERMPARGGLLKEAGTKEKVKTDDIPVSAIMRRPVVVPGDMPVREVLESFQRNEEIIVDNNGQICLVTPRDVLELFAAGPKSQLYVQITGMHDEPVEFKARMDAELNSFVNKMSRTIHHIEYLVIHVEKMHKQGPKEKYSIRARFKTREGLFVAHTWGWKPLDVINDVFKTLETEVRKRYGKAKNLKKMSRRKERYA